ncbi:MAG: hypothetical protein WKG32_15565 [Gemmatimonadaceae bacterium]
MAGALGIYGAAHSPLRGAAAALIRGGQEQCVAECAQSGSFARALDSAAALTLILAALLAAWVIADRFRGAPAEAPLAFGLSALAFISVPAAAVGLLGDWRGAAPLRPPLGPWLCAVPAVAVVVAAIRGGWRPRRPRVAWERPSGLVLLVGGLAVALLIASATISLMHPPTGYDALAYHAPLAVYFWRDGNLGALLDRTPGAPALAHPGAAELWFGLLRIAGGEGVADFGQWPLAVLGGLAVRALTRRLWIGRGAALLAASAFLMAPIVVVQIGMQLNDVAAAALLMTAMALACAPRSSWSMGRLALIGLALGLTATTKLALLPGVAAVGLFTAGSLLRAPRRPVSGRAPAVGAAAGLMMLGLTCFAAAAPWWTRNVARYGNPIYPAALPFIGRGYVTGDDAKKDTRFVPTAAAWPLYPLIERHDEQSGLGALFAVGALPGLALAVLAARARRRFRRPLVLYALVAGLTLPAWWRLTQHEPRFLLGLFGATFAFLPASLLAVPRSRRRGAGAVLAAAAICSALVTFDQGLLPLARQPNTRPEFYDRVWNIDPIVAALPEHEGLLYQMGHATLSYAGDYPLLGRSLGRILIPIDAGATTDSVVAIMRRARVRYAYVPASPASQPVIEATYSPSLFRLEHVSTVEEGERSGTRRYLYRLRDLEQLRGP